VDPRPLDPRSVIQEALEAFEAEARERALTLTAEAEGPLPLIRADRDRLFQAVANIVGNALKVTSQGGVTIGARAQESEVVFWVRDTGPGIPEDQQGRLFEPYWRGQNVYKGAGLGLAIAKGVVEAHGGRIWLESRPGSGSTFYLTVPVAAVDGPTRTEPSIDRRRE
jgi:signal transduction histidine kinase